MALRRKELTRQVSHIAEDDPDRNSKRFLRAVRTNDAEDCNHFLNLRASEAPVDLTYIEGYGVTAMMQASQDGYWKVLNMILQSKLPKNINQQDEQGQTSLHHAAFHGNWREVDTLIMAKADVNLLSLDGQNPLMKAVYGKCGMEMVQMFLNAKSDLNQQSRHGLSALMIAAQQNNSNAVKCLRRAGADLELKDDKGNTALLLCARMSNLSLVEYLTKWGADTTVVNDAGETIKSWSQSDITEAKMEEAVAQGKGGRNRRGSVAAMAGFDLERLQNTLASGLKLDD